MNKIFWPWFKYLDYLHSKYLKKYPYPMNTEEYNKDVVKLSILYSVPVIIVAGGFFVSAFCFKVVIPAVFIYVLFAAFHVTAIAVYERKR